MIDPSAIPSGAAPASPAPTPADDGPRNDFAAMIAARDGRVPGPGIMAAGSSEPAPGSDKQRNPLSLRAHVFNELGFFAGIAPQHGGRAESPAAEQSVDAPAGRPQANRIAAEITAQSSTPATTGPDHSPWASQVAPHQANAKPIAATAAAAKRNLSSVPITAEPAIGVAAPDRMQAAPAPPQRTKPVDAAPARAPRITLAHIRPVAATLQIAVQALEHGVQVRVVVASLTPAERRQLKDEIAALLSRHGFDARSIEVRGRASHFQTVEP